LVIKMVKKNKDRPISILRGVVLPSRWDKDGKVMRISLNTQDENEYIIENSGRGEELLNYLRELIEIEGKVLQQNSGALYVKVNDYSLINER